MCLLLTGFNLQRFMLGMIALTNTAGDEVKLVREYKMLPHISCCHFNRILDLNNTLQGEWANNIDNGQHQAKQH